MTDDRMTAHDVIDAALNAMPADVNRDRATRALAALKAAGWELGLSQEMGHMTAPCGGWVGGWTPEETP